MSLSDFGAHLVVAFSLCVCVCVLWKRQSKENIIVKIHERGRQGRRLCAVCVRSTESEIVEDTLLYSTEHTVWELTEVWGVWRIVKAIHK